MFTRAGDTARWRGRLEIRLIGPAEAHWDDCFIARYPSAAAFLAMVTDPAYREAVKHRQAAVAGSRLVRLGEVAGDAGGLRSRMRQKRWFVAVSGTFEFWPKWIGCYSRAASSM